MSLITTDCYREYNYDRLTETMEAYYKDIVGFHPIFWLEDRNNIALTDGEGNYSLFEYVSSGVYCGHYFFSVRGKSAIILAKSVLKKMFEEYDAKIIKGYTPLTNLGARWMSRKLGFTGYGVIETMAGPCELFILSKKEYLNG